MTYYVALRTADEFTRDVHALFERIESGEIDVGGDMAHDVALEFVDIIIHRLAYDLIDTVDLSSMQKKMFRKLAVFIEKSANALVGRMAGKMSAEELAPLIDYFKQRELTLDEGDERTTYFAFPMPEDAAQRLLYTFDEIDRGNGIEIKEAYHDAMDELVDVIFTNLMDMPASFLSLGNVMKRIVNLAFKSIRKGQKAAWNHSVDELTQQDMEAQARYLRSLLKEIT